ncbi:MAG TPA: hypothetical protein VF138_09575 [Caulobacteraceae bacterium]
MDEQLIDEAEAVERLAKVVSYGPDKARLMALAASLRERAEAPKEARSWAPRQRRAAAPKS